MLKKNKNYWKLRWTSSIPRRCICMGFQNSSLNLKEKEKALEWDSNPMEKAFLKFERKRKVEANKNSLVPPQLSKLSPKLLEDTLSSVQISKLWLLKDREHAVLKPLIMKEKMSSFRSNYMSGNGWRWRTTVLFIDVNEGKHSELWSCKEAAKRLHLLPKSSQLSAPITRTRVPFKEEMSRKKKGEEAQNSKFNWWFIKNIHQFYLTMRWYKTAKSHTHTYPFFYIRSQAKKNLNEECNGLNPWSYQIMLWWQRSRKQRHTTQMPISCIWRIIVVQNHESFWSNSHKRLWANQITHELWVAWSLAKGTWAI